MSWRKKDIIIIISKIKLSKKQYEDIKNSDALIFAFPLYIDSIPSHLLRLLVDLEEQTFSKKDIMVYCLVNNGFFEGKQNWIAIEQMKNWCKAVGLIWGQAVGIGAGEMMPFIKDIPLGHGPNKNIGGAIDTFSHNILSGNTGTDLLVSLIGQEHCGKYSHLTRFGILVQRKMD